MPNRKDLADRRYCMPDPLAVLTDETILGQIPRGSRVLDLGCGDGRLLARLRDGHDASVQGIELDIAGIVASMENGVPVIQADLDAGLAGFADQSFDLAVLSQTLQQVRHPRVILREMLRVAREALIVVPNFAHWRVRAQIVRHGRAPKTAALPYEWYDTPNLHWMSMIDFRVLCGVLGATIVREIPLRRGRPLSPKWLANLRADSAMYVLTLPKGPTRV
jgi:methionine biosynthesis protein MetW